MTLLEKINSLTWHNLINKLKDILKGLNDKPSGSEPKYKVYTALLTQTGTDAPVATVLENTLGGDIVWSRDQAGSYIASLTGAFTEKKVTLFNNIVQNGDNTKTCEIEFYRLDSNSIALDTKNFDGTDLLDSDDILNSNSIEIRVYN